MRLACRRLLVLSGGLLLAACSSSSADRSQAFLPSEVIDLGTLVTPDLPQRLWGTGLLARMGFTRQNAFEVIRWEFPVDQGVVQGSNAYYTLFNHGGPHVDAPNHMGWGGGLDSYPIEAFSGPLRVFDVRTYPFGRSIPRDVFENKVRPGEVVLIFTGYVPPQSDTAMPAVRTLTSEAAEYLARLPVRAYGTDAFSVESLGDATTPLIHQSFLRRGIPVYEQLFNVGRLLDRPRAFFVGVPLNVQAGDGMMVRPIAFLY